MPPADKHAGCQHPRKRMTDDVEKGLAIIGEQ
jgi:hypothetical protein